MPYEIQEIKAIRKKLGLTQLELAKQSNVSQSLITKIEAGTLDPTYSKVQQIFEVLNSLFKTKEKKAKDIMNKKLIGIKPDTEIPNIIQEMRKHSISQMPVQHVIKPKKQEPGLSHNFTHEKLLQGKLIKEILDE